MSVALTQAVPGFDVLSRRIRGIQGSRTLESARKANALRAQGRDVINLGIGELGFDVPGNIKEAAVAAVLAGHAQSTPVAGITPLREAIAEKLLRENGLEYEVDQILVSAGTKQVIFNAMVATLDPGDEVIVPSPFWVSYPEIVRMSGGTPVVVRTSAHADYKIQPSELEAAITPRTKWLVVNSPNNPSGAVYTPAELSALAEVLRGHPAVHVLSDEIYERFVYEPSVFANMLNAAPWLADRVLLLNGLSKTYSMIGWRLGYGAGPAPLIAAMTKVQSQVTSGTSSIIQVAGVQAIAGSQAASDAFVESFRRRRLRALELIAGIPDLPCYGARGAFYLYPDCSAYLGRRTKSDRKSVV